MEQIRKIIVPTDFSVKSLKVVIDLVESADTNDTFDIVLLHGVYPPSSIAELLFIHPAKYIRDLETEEFKEACAVIKNKFQSRVHSMCIDVITSESKAYFRNYVERNEITEIVLPKGVELDFSGKHSFDIISLLRKSKLPITEIQLGNEQIDVKFRNDLSDLLLSSDSLTS